MITENTSAIPEQLASTLRAFLIALGAYLAGKGWIDEGLASAAVPLILVGGPWIYNQMKIRNRHKVG
jgi:hypothetical protein